MARRLRLLFNFIVFTSLAVFMAQHSYEVNRDRISHDWTSNIWADAAGYYTYLPATFIYGWDAAKMPAELDKRLGYGMTMFPETGKIKTKYPYVPALFELPAFLIIHYIVQPEGPLATGFSGDYQYVLIWSGWFWGMMGMLLLFLLLRRFVNDLAAWITVLALLAGTNITYYISDASGFSHIYSFFLVTAFIRLLQSWIDSPGRGFKIVLLFFTGGLIVMARPINILMPAALLFWEVNTLQDFKKRMRAVFASKPALAVGLIAAFLAALPQLLYWRYLSGSAILYSYGQEGFPYLLQPRFGEFWFAPHNGLFAYAPVVLLLLAGCVLLAFRRLSIPPSATGIIKTSPGTWGMLFALAAFLFMSYMSASWHAVQFGCGFGQRNVVDYLPLLAPGIARLLHWIMNVRIQKAGTLLKSVPWKTLPQRALLAALILISVNITYRLYRVYNVCFFGKGGTWDWKEYSAMYLQKEVQLSRSYESTDIAQAEKWGNAPWGDYVLHITPKFTYYPGVEISGKKEKLQSPFRQGLVTAWVYIKSPQPNGYLDLMMHEIDPNTQRDTAQFFYRLNVLPDSLVSPGKWVQIRRRVSFPGNATTTAQLSLYPANHDSAEFWIDGLSLQVE